jgi:hypothetical protein
MATKAVTMDTTVAMEKRDGMTNSKLDTGFGHVAIVEFREECPLS